MYAFETLQYPQNMFMFLMIILTMAIEVMIVVHMGAALWSGFGTMP